MLRILFISAFDGRVLFIVLLFLFCRLSLTFAESGGGNDAVAILEATEKWQRLRAMQSSTGSVSISGECLDARDKLLYLRFVDDVRGRLERLTGSSFSGENYVVSIHAEVSEKTESVSTIHKSFQPSPKNAKGRPTIIIGLINPDQLDPRELAAELCDGFICMKVIVASTNNRIMHRPARWFANGLAQYLEEAARQDDAEDVISMWFGGQLEPVWRLGREFSPYASTDRRIAAQLAAYWLSFPDRKERIDRLCNELASGEKWTPELFLKTSSGIGDIFEADKDFDVWLLGRRESVLTPGVARKELLIRTWRRMLLNPGEEGVPADVPAASSLLLLLTRIEEDWVQVCAKSKMEWIMKVAAGRDAAFQESAGAYRDFLEPLAMNNARGRAKLDLEVLEEKLKRAERLLKKNAAQSVIP
ncbi:MAG: hypothetical protein GX804_06535 [Lentisphaerae bacterium]|jgi:hypothetical protein|nr:hypothetical protein [Lentisphaerota bacterium]